MSKINYDCTAQEIDQATDIIYRMFDWEDSKEGVDFWVKVVEALGRHTEKAAKQERKKK